MDEPAVMTSDLAAEIGDAQATIDLGLAELELAIRTAGRSEIGRMLAIARTDLETSLLWLEKAEREARG